VTEADYIISFCTSSTYNYVTDSLDLIDESAAAPFEDIPNLSLFNLNND
jgi:hypothetical protein